ncbi:chondroitin AC/alginate lyase [Spinellus fusiger]|nr:chondroitin AC/alginate lyase [Spinellus fusiger]
MRLSLSTTAICVALGSVFVNADVNQDMSVILGRKTADLISTAGWTGNVQGWANSLSSGGTWSDIDYTSGCSARPASWPAQNHFLRIVTMASAWNQNKSNSALLAKISTAMNYWFNNDFKTNDCIDKAGTNKGNCPCGTPGFWNTNWYDQMIAMPETIGAACILLKSALTTFQYNNCVTVTQRSYSRINTSLNGVGVMTGANRVDVSIIGAMLGLLTNNPTTFSSALNNFYGSVVVSATGSDGIQADGAFLQHNSQIYNGNYGQDYMGEALRVFIQTAGTSFAPNQATQSAFLTVIAGSEWLMMQQPDKSQWWHYSVVGRMIASPSSYKQASGGVTLNINSISQATTGWANKPSFDAIVSRINNGNYVGPQGQLTGTRFFYSSDYMVHRTTHSVVTLRMYSKRTTGSECDNSQNKQGFHLSDGSIYNYVNGNEYVDIFPGWNWNLIPGTTVDVGGTPLVCGSTQWKGIQSFVGGASVGQYGIAVMDYINPFTKNLAWKKTYVFFPTGYAVYLDSVQSKSTSNGQPTTVVTTLDQTRLNGPVYVNGQKLSQASTSVTGKNFKVWHNSVGYDITASQMSVNTASESGSWSSIGIATGNVNVPLFTATVQNLQQYTVQLNSPNNFSNNVYMIQSHSGTATVRGIQQSNWLSLAFWTPGTFVTSTATVTSDQAIVLIVQKTDKWRVSVSDPTQSLSTVNLSFSLSQKKSITVNLPTGNLKGSTVTIDLF